MGCKQTIGPIWCNKVRARVGGLGSEMGWSGRIFVCTLSVDKLTNLMKYLY